MITVLGFPRSGTNWLHRLLSYGYDVNKVHWKYQLNGNEHVVHIRRDPRDTAVSGYYYYLATFGWKWNHTIENFALLDFLETRFRDGFDGYAGWPTGWREHAEWASGQHFHSIDYESMVIDTSRALKWILHGDWIDIAARNEPPGGLKRVLYTKDADWQNKPKVASPGIGEWKYHFGPAEIEWMDDYLG
jgi:hypothetical protein